MVKARTFFGLCCALLLKRAALGAFLIPLQADCHAEGEKTVYAGRNGTVDLLSRFETQNEPAQIKGGQRPEECIRMEEEDKQGARVIKVGTFHFPPFTIEKTDEETGAKTYSGVEVTIVRELASSLGHTVKFSRPTDGRLWGDVFWNGTSNGLLGDVLSRTVDIGMAEYFLRAARSFYGEASDYYTYDDFCVVMARPQPEARWKQWIRPFTLKTWLGVMACWVLGTIFMIVVSKATNISDNIALVNLAFYVNQSSKMSPSWKIIRTFIGPVSLGGEVLSIAYSGTLISFLAINAYPPLMEHITDLGEFSGTIASGGYTLKQSFAIHKDPIVQDFSKRFVSIWSWQKALKEVRAGNYAYFASKISTDHSIRSHYMDDFGFSPLYMIEECWNSHQIVFYYPKNSPLRRPFDARLRQMRESGLINKWIRDEMDSAHLTAGNGKRAEASPTRKLTLDDYKGILAIQATCMAACCLAFARELLWSFCSKVRRPAKKTLRGKKEEADGNEGKAPSDFPLS